MFTWANTEISIDTRGVNTVFFGSPCLTFSLAPTDAAAGGSDDWAKGAMNIKYSYTVELRRPWWEGRGRGGFILDESEIRPQGQELWAALRAVAREIRLRMRM